MTVCNLLSGSWPLMTYMQAIFEEAGATLSPNVCAIIVSLVQMTANIIAIILVDRIDRKKLYSISALCTGIGLAVLGLHSVYKDYLTEYPSMPLIAFSFIIFVSSGGMLPLHYVILLEIMPKRVKWNRHNTYRNRSNNATIQCCKLSKQCHLLHFSDTKCGKFNMYDGALGIGYDCATNIPNDIWHIRHAQLPVLIFGILLLPYHIHTCRHSRDTRQVTWNDNASTGETKIIIINNLTQAIMINKLNSFFIDSNWFGFVLKFSTVCRQRPTQNGYTKI